MTAIRDIPGAIPIICRYYEDEGPKGCVKRIEKHSGEIVTTKQCENMAKTKGIRMKRKKEPDTKVPYMLPGSVGARHALAEFERSGELDLNKISTSTKAALVLQKISPAFDLDREDEAKVYRRFHYAIVELAIRDLGSASRKQMHRAARLYLTGDMPASRICGVDPDWIREVMDAVGFPYRFTMQVSR